MIQVNDVILPEGKLNNHKIMEREVLYRGMNGRNVERVYLSPTESYIFKPLTNDSQAGKEAWVYEYVLPLIPPVYPKIIAQSVTDDSKESWILLEDLGTLQHNFNDEVVLKVTKYMANWHSIPTGQMSEIPLSGPKPFIEHIVSDVLSKEKELSIHLVKLGIKRKYIRCLINLLQHSVFSNAVVFSHGDLHLGNYALAKDRVVVLDWEHAHLNVPYWDLYHLLDMSHPLFPKQISDSFRQLALDNYVEELEKYRGGLDRKSFKQEYYIFALAFSAWMILLITKDLQDNNASWPKEKLRNQLNETVNSFLQCSVYLFDGRLS